MISVIPVILCGGSGTRLWPLSRSGFPKQFLCLTGKESLFQLAVRRVLALADENIKVSSPVIVSNEAHRFLAQEQLRETGAHSHTMILEPAGRNTAPALTLAALAAVADGEDPVLLVTPSDQAIADSSAYIAAMHQAIQEAADGVIAILGVPPKCPETGYGYIKGHADDASLSLLRVEHFVEKPDVETARRYLREGGYYWNSGMFVLRASVWLRALRHFRGDILEAAQLSWDRRVTDVGFVRPGEAEFLRIPDESVDYAVMEHCPGSVFPVRMARLDAGWSDLGAWDAVWDLLPKDDAGNACQGDVMVSQSHNTLAYAASRLVSLVGVENLVVIETPDAVLVANKARCQEVRQTVSALERQKREEHMLHRKVHRPWGWYDSIDMGERFRVKRIMVNPKASLSLQKHHHRSEHWVVVRGTAEITCGDRTALIGENQSTYIPLGETHRLANPGMIPLEIIEVQSGSYLGEDDIIRLEDHYGR
ncbi:MAG: mannose-1-phosphate guanylyltransferase/mannose-6-phosphate isomerase [Zoogloeaceae bacterium]|jgi:mannose-1-phosphate guanylyltransferase/mannose-6-phosphate isomerase|nr:mannose-1-phosphate guanylyltransferase/mannose-6-phosphate isomerase [Zoogloeaceae bacterium]